MTTSFRIVLASAIAATSVLGACSNGAEPGDPHDRLAATKDAIAKPSGKVDATSMKNLAKFYSSFQAATPVFAAMGSVAPNSKCASGGGSSGSIDLSCATQGKGTGAVTGSLDYTLEGYTSSGGNTVATVIFDLKNACSGGVCVDGNIIVEASVVNGDDKTTTAISADITQGGQKTHVYFGEQAELSSGKATSKTVFFDSLGASYVVEVAIDSMGAAYSIAGGNGSFQCSMTPQGGQCSGSASFSY